MSGSFFGCGALGAEEVAAALEMLRAGKTQMADAKHFGVTKNTIAGL